MANGFVSLGQAIAGGDPRIGEEAFLQGLSNGSLVRSRQASTENALARARVARNQAMAQEQLVEQANTLSEELGIPSSLIQAFVSGGNPEQLTGAGLDMQTGDFRSKLADPSLALPERQAIAQAVDPGIITADDILGPGGELIAELFGPDAGTVSVTPTGEADIAATGALEQQRLAAAALSDERRTNPQAFRSGGITFNVGDRGLGDVILEDIPDSTIPAAIKPEEATGVTGAFKSIVNTAFDVGNVNLPFPDADVAQNALTDLMTRTQITGQQGIPGRPSNYLMQQLASFGVTPNDPFRGDQRSVSRMAQTSRFLGGEMERLRRILNAGRSGS
jgi:hypothetical protein